MNKTMLKHFEKLINALRTVRLRQDEKEKMRSVLMEYAAHKPAEEPSKPIKSPFMYNVWLRRAVPVALVLVAVFLGQSGTGSRITSNSGGAILPPTVADLGGSEQRNEAAVEYEEGVSLSLPSIDIPAMQISESAEFGLSADSDDSAGDFDGISAPSVAREKSAVGVDIYQDELSIEPYHVQYYPVQDITDTREFLKTSFNADIQTRDVPEAVEEVEDAVRRVEGRIDSTESGEKWGHVSFVVPKSEFDRFRRDVEEIAHARLYTPHIHQENLLGQKQNIEQRADDLDESIDSLEDQRANVSASHNQKVAEIRSQITSVQQQLGAIRAAKLNVDPDDQEALLELLNQERFFSSRLVALLEAEKAENQNYAAADNQLASLIDSANTSLDNVIEEDVDFMNAVETVEGYVDIRWINMWELMEVFSPTPILLNVVVIVLILWLYWERKAKRRMEDLI